MAELVAEVEFSWKVIEELELLLVFSALLELQVVVVADTAAASPMTALPPPTDE